MNAAEEVAVRQVILLMLYRIPMVANGEASAAGKLQVLGWLQELKPLPSKKLSDDMLLD